MYIYLGIIIFVIFVAIKIVKLVQYNKVRKISEKIRKIKEVNKNFSFYEMHYEYEKFKVEAKTLNKLKVTEPEDLILFYLENDLNNLKDNIKRYILNSEIYFEYESKLNGIHILPKEENLREIEYSFEKFSKIENKLVKKLKIKNNIELNLKIIYFYRSPTGRNYYSRVFLYNEDALVDIYKMWITKKKMKNNVRLERLKMSDSLRFDVLKRDDFCCKICGRNKDDGVKLHVDHIVPVSKGGKTNMLNLQTLCERCNMGKSNKL